MEREACVCDHGFERSDLCAEIITIIIIIIICEHKHRKKVILRAYFAIWSIRQTEKTSSKKKPEHYGSRPTTMCDGVRHCFWFVFNVFLVSLHGD